MSKLVTEFDDERNNRWFLLEIDFDYSPSGRLHVSGDNYVDISGQIELLGVLVLEAVKYDDAGDEVSRFERDDLHQTTVDILDNQTYNYVEHEIDHWNQLADDMVNSL